MYFPRLPFPSLSLSRTNHKPNQMEQQSVWQDPVQDKPMRQEMIRRIYTLLRQRGPPREEEWLNTNLPPIARKLEHGLYLRANTVDEYKDERTLKWRLGMLAKEFRVKLTLKQEGH